jgi:hypothetical protein
MLRRKLLLIFGSFVVFLAVLAIAGVWLLEGVLDDLDHINNEAAPVVDQADRLTRAITAVEVELYQLQLGEKRHLDLLIDSVEAARSATDRIGTHYVMTRPDAKSLYRAIRDELPGFERQVGLLATAQDPALRRQHNIDALSEAMKLARPSGSSTATLAITCSVSRWSWPASSAGWSSAWRSAACS